MDWSTLPESRRRGMRDAIAAQCFGMLTQQMLAGGILLLYLNAMGVRPSLILLVLNFTPFLSSFLSIPFGWAADRVGIKRFGTWGNRGMIVGLSMVAAAASLGTVSPGLVLPTIFAGLVVHTIGASIFNAGWFSLLSHLVPREMTGRYFGILRFSWQFVALAFFAVSAAFFSARTPLWIYQAILLMGATALACRSIFYRNLPEVPSSSRQNMTLTNSVKTAVGLPGFASYLAYLLLLVCVSGNGQDMLRLSAVRGCGLGDNQILFLTVGSMTGSLLGFAFVGRLVDRFGAQTMFLLCHLGFALALLLFPLREFLHLRALAAGIAASFLLGVVTSTLGLATTAHSFRVCQGTQRTIAYALVSSIQTMGSGLSGFALAAVIEHMGRATGGNPFDTMLLGLGVLVVVQIAGLGLLRGSSIRMEEEVVPVPVSRGGSSDEELEISTT